MEITLRFKFHEGVPRNPRPSLRITVRAQRWTSIRDVEELIHTRLVDAPFPKSLAQGVEMGIRRLTALRLERDPLWGPVPLEDLEWRAHRLVG